MSAPQKSNDFNINDYQHLYDGGITEIMNFNPTPTIVRNRNDRIVFWNYAAERVYGYTMKEARGLVWYELLQTTFPHAHSNVRQSFEMTGVWKGELVSHAKDKSTLVIRSHWMRLGGKIASNTNDLIMQVDFDVTHEKYDRELLKSLDLAFKASNIVNWIWDFTTNKINWFGDTKPIFGREQSEIATYESWEQYILPEDVPELREALDLYTHTRETYEGEFRCQWPDKSIHWILARGRVYVFPAGTPNLMVGINVEITDQKLEEQRLQAALEVAEEANKIKSTFITHMSHEMRTPLTSIIGYSQLLKEEVPGRDGVVKIADIIHRNGLVLLELVDNILNLAVIQNDNLPIKKRATNLESFMKDVLDTIAPLAKSKGVELIYQVGDDLPVEIVTDPNRLRQILLNLLNNAIKFTSRGYIKICTQALRSENLLGFYVEDSGKGIAAGKREKIFEPFEQEDEGFTRRYGGAGLGLSISRSLAMRLGGNLKLLRSGPNGSMFFVTVAVQ